MQLDTNSTKGMPKPTNPPVRQSNDEDRADDLLRRAQEAQAEQTALLEATPIEAQYGAALANLVDAKHNQVENVEARLEGMIERQQARLQQTQANKPGLTSMPGKKRAWREQQAKQQDRLQTLHNRLESVRETKEGMGVHAPRIEKLATRKLRAENPELASDWDAMREAARRHQAHMRMKEGRAGRSHSLGLTAIPR